MIPLDIDASFLDQFPTYVFSELVQKWQDLSVTFKPNGLLSEENFGKTNSILQSLSTNRINRLQKLATILALTNNK